MKTLSIRQPWAFLIVRPDVTDPAERAELYRTGRIKTVENRDWSSSTRGWILVHASKSIDREGIEKVRARFPDIRLPETYDLGGIIGAMHITACVDNSESPWFVGRYGFVIDASVPLPFAEMRGQLWFFEAPANVLPANIGELLQTDRLNLFP